MQIEIRGAERLSYREKQVTVLKEMGFSTEEIAGRLNLSSGTVATLYGRARAKGYQVVIVVAGDPLAIFGSESDAGEEGTRSEG
ncbi:MAG: sigma-70 region 4 domain-containing protein [Bacillota bacterium]